MATVGLYGSSTSGVVAAATGSESTGLYGNTTSFGGSYFEWFIFQQAETQPATPTGGSWSFTTNSGTPPAGWSSLPPAAPTDKVWVSIALVNSKTADSLTWSVPGLFSYTPGFPILSGNGSPAAGLGKNDQLYIQLDTTPQTIWFKETGTWTRLTGSTLYADLTSNQTIGGVKTFSNQIQGSVSGTASNVTGVVGIANGGTGSTTASAARTALGAAASGANSDITSLSGITGAIGTADYVAFDTTYTTTLAAGQLGWDGNNTLGLGMAGGNVVQKIGEDQFYYIKASSAITKGQVVMFTGSVGASGVVTGAPATGITDGSYIMGIAAETIALNGFGLVQFEGTLKGVNTSAFTDGAILWYNPAVTGGLTATQPSAPNVKVQMAAVINAGSGGSGSMLIRVTAGSVLGGTDSNVQFSTLVNGNIIQYDSALGYWKNVAPTSVAVTTFSGGTTGLTPATATAGDVTLGGTLAIANGGTGQTTANAAFNALAPSQTGNAGKYLTTDGTNTSWATNPLGTVTSVDASGGTTGMSFTGGPITSSGTLTLTGTLAVANGGTGVTTSTGTGSVVLSTSPTLVTPALGTPTSGNFSTGTFTWPTFNQNTTGTASNVTGVVAIANGGTGQTTANAAFNALAPSQTGNAGKYLTTDGTNTSWATNPLGTVTSVDVSGGTTGLTTSGGPITSSGTITLAGTLAVANGGTGATTASGARTNLDVPGLADANTFTNTNVISVNSASDALRITQTGAGNALLVEDSANPDSTPFVIDANGAVFISTTPTSAFVSPTTHPLQVYNAATLGMRFTDTASSAFVSKLAKARGTIASPSILASGDAISQINFQGYDGSKLIEAATITAAVDGTPGTNDMPGRLVFSTTADGAATVTERMRIDSQGRVGIGSFPFDGVGSLYANRSITGNVFSYGVLSSGTVQSDVTSHAYYFRSTAATQATSFTATALSHFGAEQGTFGAGSTVTNQYGYNAGSSLIGATNNFGFYSNIASGTGRWNFYAAGTADNYFAGSVGIGAAAPATVQLNVSAAAGAQIRIIETGGGVDTRVNSTGGVGLCGIVGTYSNHPLVWYTNAGEKGRITAGGTWSLGAVPGSESLRVTPIASAVNYTNVRGGPTGVGPIIEAFGSDTNIDLYMSSKGSGRIGFYTNSFIGGTGIEQFRVAHTASAVNYWQFNGAPTANNIAFYAQGSDTNIGVNYVSKGTGAHVFLTGGGSQTQFAVTHTASAVNYLQATGSATGNGVGLSAQGSDTNVQINILAKGSAGVSIGSYSGKGGLFVSAPSAAVNYVQADGANTGNAPVVSAQGSDTNINLKLTPKGTGRVQYGTHTATSDTAISGYIEILDSAGNVRKLAVIS